MFISSSFIYTDKNHLNCASVLGLSNTLKFCLSLDGGGYISSSSCFSASIEFYFPPSSTNTLCLNFPIIGTIILEQARLNTITAAINTSSKIMTIFRSYL